MTHEEIVEVLKFAGVPDAERLATAFEAANPYRGKDLPAGVPSCPSCAAPPAEVAWLGALPDRSGQWRCARCAHAWVTPPAGSSGG